MQGVAQYVFGPFVFAFELTAALLLVAALAAIILAHGERLKKRETHKDRVRRRTRQYAEQGTDPGPLPGPGIYARHNSADYPALLPDGSVAENSISPTLRVRGVAIVENDGLRSAHRAAITKFVAVGDEAAGTDLADEVAAELDDFGRPELPAGDADTEEQER